VLLTFSDRVLYPSYAAIRGPARALEDQVMAGVLVWGPISVAYLVPAVVVTLRLLSRPARPALVPRLEGSA
jgi:hypothetical protein